MTSRRLFVGNLHEDIQSGDLQSRFATFGTVSNVEVRTKNEAVFAFVDVQFTDESGARRCVDVLNNTKWKGLTLKVQIAKENFIEKLKKERAAAGLVHEGKDYRQQYKARYQKPAKPDNFDFEIVSKSDLRKKSTPPPRPEVPRPISVRERKNGHQDQRDTEKPAKVLKREAKVEHKHKPEVSEPVTTLNEKKKTTLPISKSEKEIPEKSKTDPVTDKPKSKLISTVSTPKEIEVSSSPKKAKPKTKEISSDSGSDSDSSESEQEHDGIPKFRGLGFYPGLIPPPRPKKPEESKEEDDVKGIYTEIARLDVEAPTFQPQPQEKSFSGLKLNPRKKAKSDQLRIQAVESRQKLQDTRSNVIRNALSKIDPETPAPTPDHKVSKANTDFLFGAEEDAEDDSFSLAIKPQYEGKSGQKMLELKAKHGFDSRFQMDERFAEKSKRKNNNESATDQDMEKDTQMEILGQILGPSDPSVRAPKPKPKVADQIMQFVRYDPTLPAHKVYEKPTKVEVEGPAPKIRKIKDMEKPSDAKHRIEEEKEKLKDPNAKTTFKVAANLKSLFTAEPEQEKTFSLLKAFGGNTEPDEDTKASRSRTPKKSDSNTEKSTNGTSSQSWTKKNPFKYDSSDTEDDEEADAKKLKSKKTTKDNKKLELPASAPGPKNFLKQDLFKKDPLFFKNDDQRLQGVFDQFLATSEDLAQVTQEFNESGRSELKAIAKSKVKNSKRKNEKKVKIMRLVRKKKRRELMRKQKNNAPKPKS